MTFRSLMLRKEGDDVTVQLEDVEKHQLPDGDVEVAVEYSGMNYKDALVVKGLGRLVKEYPHVPGIDFAGEVTASSGTYAVGDKVILTGWRCGELWWGGLGQYASVKSEWLVPLPSPLTTAQAMGVGTAGFTAMLCVMALEEHGITPSSGPVLVTGAGGGVGSVAVAILAKLGYEVMASTGRAETHDYLRNLGASQIVDRSTLSEKMTKPLQSETYAGAVDTVGSHTLANVLTQIKYGGSVAACGLAQGNDLPASVVPFILRGVNLLGIDSVMCPFERRKLAWNRIATDLPLDLLETITETHPLSAVPELADQILKGRVRGRTVIDVNSE